MDKENISNGFEYVDLGLPSGTLWATMNVGASKPSDYGLYFQWGDIIGYPKDQVGIKREQKMFSTDCCDYKWGRYPNLTKYTSPSDKLELEDDAAHFYMGGGWHIPSPEQIYELLDNTAREWATLDNVDGMMLTSKKDTSKFIFFPAAGYAWGCSIDYDGSYGNIWSSTLDINSCNYGQSLNFKFEESCSFDGIRRDCGFPIRGVMDKKRDEPKDKESNMNKNLNLVEILKDAPKGTKLWSPICGVCEFAYNTITNCVVCNSDNKYWAFASDGKFAAEGECMLFPSKENRDWSTFKVPKQHKHFEPFQKVLIKDKFCSKYFWVAALYSHFDESTNKHYLVGADWAEDDDIISYDGNEDKLGKIIEK